MILAPPPPPPVALSASPPRIALAPRETRALWVTNPGRAPAVVAVVPAGYAVALRGRPKVEPQRRPTWLRLNPSRLTLAPRTSATVTVSARPPRGLGPGDHAALVVLRMQPRAGDIAVRMQIGIVVVMRVPGKVRHRVHVQDLRVRRGVLELTVANRGNVSERLSPRRLRVTIVRGGRVVARPRPPARELLPSSRGVITMRYRVRGRCKVIVVLDGVHYRVHHAGIG
jgi:hypothetical protein